MSNLFIFYKKNKTDKRVIIFAQSYIEAKETLFALNNYADIEYDLNEYRLQIVDTDKLYEELHLKDYEGYPYILTEENYNHLVNYIENKTFSNIHNTQILTKKRAEWWSGSDKNNFPSTQEFIEVLKNNAEHKEALRNEICSMFKNIGEVWYARITRKYSKLICEDIIYGRSRYEVIETYNKLLNDKLICDKWGTPSLLIENYPNYTQEDIDRYIKFKNYIKEHNIKQLPIITDY